MNHHAIEIRGLCKQYPGFALRDISLDLPTGSIVGLGDGLVPPCWRLDRADPPAERRIPVPILRILPQAGLVKVDIGPGYFIIEVFQRKRPSL